MMNKRKSAAEAFSSKQQCDTDFPITLKNSFTCYTIDSLWVPIFPGISGGKQEHFIVFENHPLCDFVSFKSVF